VTILFLFFVGIVFALLVATHTLLIETMARGRGLTKSNWKRPHSSFQKFFHELSPLDVHRKLGRAALLAMILLAVFLEAGLCFFGIHHPSWFRAFHIICLGLPSLVGLALVCFPLNGTKTKYHGRFAYTVYGFFTAATLTGIPLFVWDVWQYLHW